MTNITINQLKNLIMKQAKEKGFGTRVDNEEIVHNYLNNNI